MTRERTVPLADVVQALTSQHVREEVRQCMRHAPVFQVEGTLPDILSDLLAALDGDAKTATESF